MEDPVEQALRAADLLLQSSGFGMVAIDLASVPLKMARRIPLTTWFRFRRAVEHTSTALIVVEEHPHAKSCASLVMEFSAQSATWNETAEQTSVVAHDAAPLSGSGVQFCVTSEGIAVPFESAQSSFATPQRWNTPQARLLDTMHVYLRVSRSRAVQKFPAAATAKSVSSFEFQLSG